MESWPLLMMMILLGEACTEAGIGDLAAFAFPCLTR